MISKILFLNPTPLSSSFVPFFLLSWIYPKTRNFSGKTDKQSLVATVSASSRLNLSILTQQNNWIKKLSKPISQKGTFLALRCVYEHERSLQQKIEAELELAQAKLAEFKAQANTNTNTRALNCVGFWRD